jgi:hypothetical protein
MPASMNLNAYLRAVFSKAGGLASPSTEYIINLAASLDNGTLDTQIDKAWGDTRSIAALEDLDLNGTAIKDAFGDNLAFVDVCGVFVATPAANTGNVIVGAAAATAAVLATGAATHTRIIKPGGFDFWFAPAGWPVVAGTSDLLRVAPSAGTQVYSIIVVGRSA